MRRAERVEGLRALGFRVRSDREYAQQVGNFQRGWNLGPALAVDNAPGPKFDEALEASLERLADDEPTASAHFSFAEFACKCGGRFDACQRIWIMRDLLTTLEDVRATFYPGGLVPMSGCRCTGHNHAVGGASSSQHMYGAACDLTPKVRYRDMAKRVPVAGIGYNASTGLVAHVDRRDVSGHNLTGASVKRPTTWIYHR